jgi:hypothetical protein
MDNHGEARVRGRGREPWSIAKQSAVVLAAGAGLVTVGPAEGM